MKNLVRLVLCLVLVFSASVCFAGVKEDAEELELNSEILNPINSNFGESASLSRLLSIKLIEMKKKRGEARDSDEEDSRLDEAESAIESELGLTRVSEMHKITDVCEKYAVSVFDPHIDNAVGSFAISLSLSWHKKIANCNTYTNLVMFAFEFNQMNNTLLGKDSRFEEAVIAETNVDGNHILVLVQGKSGAMFVVDPWIQQVIKLKNVIKLSEVDHSRPTPPYLSSFSLSSLFGQRYNDKVYYAEIFVDRNTEWNLNLKSTKTIQDFAHINNSDMKSFYESLDGGKPSRKFPVWQLGYDKLVPKSGEVKHKEPDTKKRKSNEETSK